MTYAAQASEIVRQQVRYGTSGQIVSYWPKIAGVGNVAVTGTPTYTLYGPSVATGGTSLASGNCTATTIDSITRIDISVDVSSTSSFPIQSFYRLELSWVYSGTTYYSSVYFDVVREPFLPLLSANDFVDEVSDAESRLSAQASRMESGRTAEQHASILGLRAWSDVHSWLVQKIPSSIYSPAHLLIDRELIRRVVVAQAVHRMYAAEGGPEGSESWSLSNAWKKEATQRYEALPPLQFDATQDLAPDSISSSGGTFKWRRSW